MRSRAWAPVGCALLVAVFLTDLVVQPGGTHLTRTIDDIAEMLAAATGAGAAVWRARRSLGRNRLSWYFVAGGCGGWAIGEAIWCYYELLRGIDTPFPSWADAGFLVFPVLALIGLLLRPSAAFAGQGRLRVALDAMLVASSLFVISWVTALGEVYQQGGDSRFAAIVSLAYPVSDLVLLTVAVIVVSYARTGDRGGLLYSSFGFIALCVGDSGFAYLTAVDKYGDVNLIDSGWVAGFLIIAVAAIVDNSNNASHRLAVPPRTALLLPYAPAAAAIGVALHENTTHGIDASTTVAITVLVASLIARQMLVLVDNRRLMDRIAHQAFHDTLTGLANRALFNDRLGHALDLHRRDLREVTVLLIDLDDFKTVNDTLGHPAGDELLVRVSERLRAVLRTGDTVARLGGDEFAVLMEDGGDALESAARVLASLEQVVVLGSRSIPVGASIGIAALRPEDPCTDAIEMLKRADLAMYAAKRAGKRTVCTYTGDLEVGENSELDLRAAFTADLNAGQIDVAFQPIQLADGRLSGFEALARWTHQGSPVAPATFLPMARRMNCVHRVDQVVVRKAVTEAVAWGHDYVLSVNLDGATLTEPGFVDWLAHTLRSTGLAPRRLAVEVLETSLIEHDEPALDALARLRELGVRVVVDDFGAGYASLVRLQALQPDIVKIDRSLVAVQTDPTTATPLLSGVAQLAHQMGAIVVAEGIETPTQLTAAIAAGCDAVQGYLLGRPTTPEACRLLVAQAQDVPTQA